MENFKIATRAAWIVARKELLAQEKEFTRLRDELSQKRRDLPRVRVDKSYVFEGSNGKETLPQLFEGRSQLIVYHFMFDPSWDAGCKSCSFWADNFNGIIVHLKHRDVTMIAVSGGPYDKSDAYLKRMGWSLKWVSSAATDFNLDYNVTHKTEET